MNNSKKMISEQSTILIIEDDDFQRRLLSKQLTMLINCDIQQSCDGEEALNILNNFEPDIIFCDLNLPVVDGVELIRYIAQKKLNSSLVLISGEANDILSSVKTMSEKYGLKNIHLLQKPMGVKVIAEVLSKIKYHGNACQKKTPPQLAVSTSEISQAFNSGQFIAYYQPHIAAQSRAIVGAEALIRWAHPEHGILTPNFFLAKLIAENFSEKLTHLIAKLAIKQCKKWHDGGHFISISINVTPTDLMNLTFADYIFSLLAYYKLDPSYLTLEVTESEITENMANFLDNLSRLRLKGVQTSIDDFGTGNASLLQLVASPFSELKIDLSFVNKMFKDNKYMEAVKAATALAKALKLKIVAEGVENKKQAEFLTELGCDILQGFLFSPALNGQDFISHLNMQKPI